MDGLRELGVLVKRHRSDAGLSGAELARRAEVSQPSVWRVESGRRLSDVATVERLASALMLDAGSERHLVELARAAYGESARPRVDSGVSMIAGQLDRYLQAARVVRSFSSAAIPELLRTPEYAAAAAACDVPGSPDAAGLLANADRSFVFVVTEAALRTWPGTANMADQLGQVLAAGERPNVRLGVVPSDVVMPRVPLHGFVVLDERAVWMETFTAELTLTHAGDVAAYAGCFAAFEKAAVFGRSARVVVERVAASWARISAL
jgi:transcriptional regulator with XRE-family HTH domain